MREILFRGKAINRDRREYRTDYKNGDWVYGLFMRKYDERFENLPAEMSNEYGVTGIEVDYKTISEYTGLTDTSGKKIFEGDIVRVVDIYNHTVIYSIDYKSGSFCINQKGVNFSTDLGSVYNGKYEIEVIGNIYDNPELLNKR